MSDGWIKLHRKSLESRVFSDAALWRLWTWCLLKANHAPGFFCGEEILPGSFATGTRVAGDALGLSPSTVHRGLKRLAEWSMVELKVKRGYTVVTICNYATYQESNQPSETLVKQTCNADETLMKPNKNNNNNKNLPPSPPPATQGGDSPRSAAWKGVEEDLLKCGVSAAGKAVDAAIANGCRPDDVIAVVAFWRCSRPKWGAGALYQRILNLRPGQDQSELWPDPSEQFVASEQRTQSVKSQVAQSAKWESHRKEKAADTMNLAELESEHGPKIDAMSCSELAALVRREFPNESAVLLKQIRNGRPSRLLREMILPLFSEVPQGPTLVLETL
jgi:hypothetical protein